MRIVVALGGNALLRRGEPMTVARQRANAGRAALALAQLANLHTLVVTHGNGPQIGLLAGQSQALGDEAVYPLDVLDAESEGMIGYLLELELRNRLPDNMRVATVLTMVEVDACDPRLSRPTKFIGPVYATETEARRAEGLGWVIARDGTNWRRVVASPRPARILQMEAIRRLSGRHGMVICAGGGGVPVARDEQGALVGVEAVVDKDLTSELLARELGAEALILATDVAAVYVGWQTARERAIRLASPEAMAAMSFPAGSMGPKVEAACRFAEMTGRPAVIGALEDLPELLAGRCGTTVLTDAGATILAPAVSS